jgi:hypothetical protein
MKTNVIMQSKDRELFGITIKQETKTGFLSLTALQKAYESARWEFGWSERSLTWIMQTQDFKERVYYLLENQGYINESINSFIERINEMGIAKLLKSLNVYKTTGARHTKEVMCNPYIWVLLAMELNPMIYAKVVIWLTDTLIFDRIEAGTEYRPMNDAIKKIIPNAEFYKYAMAINERVFGKHFAGMRNLASANELKKITKLEQFITNSIEIGMITNDNQIMNAIQKINI